MQTELGTSYACETYTEAKLEKLGRVEAENGSENDRCTGDCTHELSNDMIKPGEVWKYCGTRVSRQDVGRSKMTLLSISGVGAEDEPVAGVSAPEE